MKHRDAKPIGVTKKKRKINKSWKTEGKHNKYVKIGRFFY